MKKIIFSAIAVVAFVGSSMANTSEVKEVLIKQKAAFSQCTDVYNSTYISAKANGANDTQAGIVAWAAYSTCVDKKITDIQP